MPTFDGSLTPAEDLIMRTMSQAIQDGYTVQTGATRTANMLGLARRRVMQLWLENRAGYLTHA